jgi:hypothetical protein
VVTSVMKDPQQRQEKRSLGEKGTLEEVATEDLSSQER